jgi:hypothetical protein
VATRTVSSRAFLRTSKLTFAASCSGDPSECDIWLQKEGGNATYFAHVSVPPCRYDFSSWPTALQPNGSRSIDTYAGPPPSLPGDDASGVGL